MIFPSEQFLNYKTVKTPDYALVLNSRLLSAGSDRLSIFFFSTCQWDKTWRLIHSWIESTCFSIHPHSLWLRHLPRRFISSVLGCSVGGEVITNTGHQKHCGLKLAIRLSQLLPAQSLSAVWRQQSGPGGIHCSIVVCLVHRLIFSFIKVTLYF